MWIFAYGSLIFRPAFSYLERRPAFVHGFVRRFWQGSPDHRGVPGAPGRVVTLLPSVGDVCGGAGYRIDPTEAPPILAALDVREQAGFARTMLPMMGTADIGAAPFAEGLTWVATEANGHFLGPLPEDQIADVVRQRRGPSGENVDYVVSLAKALRELGIEDAHVEAIARHLRG